MKTPLIVPDNQIKSLQIICEKEGSDTLVLQEEVTKFKQGEKVKIIEGDFVGVTGIVATLSWTTKSGFGYRRFIDSCNSIHSDSFS